MGRKQEYVDAPDGQAAPSAGPVILVVVLLPGAVLCVFGALVV